MANLLGTVPDISEIYGHLENATLQGMSAYEVAVKNGYTGTEAEWLASLKGETGETPNIQVGNVSTGQPGTNASATMTGTKDNPVLNMTIPRGDVGATPNMTIGTVTTGEEGTQAQATITGTPENPVLNLTIPRGDTGDAGFDPIVEVTKDGNTATVSVTDATHTTEVNIVDGYTPQKNVDYFDGHSPKITGTKSQGTTFIYSDGEQIGAVTDGEDGYTPRKGVDYFDGHTPAISGEKIDDTTFIYADGVRIATVLDGLDGNSPVITTVKSGKTTSILADSVVVGTISDGVDGHSPTITTTKSGKTTTILSDGTSIGSVTDGQDGHSPEITTNKVGKVLTILSDGQTIGTVSDGADAVAPTITTNKSGNTTTIYSNGESIGTVVDGTNGISSIVTVSKSGTTTTVYVDGVASASIEDGADGSTPVITATKSGTVTTIKSDNIDIATINDGTPGEDGFSPTVVIQKENGVATVTITDENGTTSAEILDGTSISVADPNNDGNIVLNNSIIGVVVDDEPTNGSPNAVSSGGVYNQIKRIDDFQSLVDSATNQATVVPMVANKYINMGGTRVSMTDGHPAYASDETSYSVGYIACDGGDEFTVSGNGGGVSRLWGFVDSTGLILSVSATNAEASGLVVKAPENSAWFITHSRNPVPTYKGSRTAIDIVKVNSDLDEFKADYYLYTDNLIAFEDPSAWEQKTLDGSVNGYTIRSAQKIPVTGGSTLYTCLYGLSTDVFGTGFNIVFREYNGDTKVGSDHTMNAIGSTEVKNYTIDASTNGIVVELSTHAYNKNITPGLMKEINPLIYVGTNSQIQYTEIYHHREENYKIADKELDEKIEAISAQAAPSMALAGFFPANSSGQYPEINTTAKTFMLYDSTTIIDNRGANQKYIVLNSTVTYDYSAVAAQSTAIMFTWDVDNDTVKAFTGIATIDYSKYIPLVLFRRDQNVASACCPVYIDGLFCGKIDEAKINQGSLWTNPNVRSINHRGYTVIAPENTLPAFRLSKNYGYECVETDVQFTSDGVAVLLHDASINRTARNSDGTELSSTVNIASITYEQSQTYDFGVYKSSAYTGTKIPTFKQFLIACRRLGLHPYIELKVGTQAQIEGLVDAVALNGMKGKVTWISYDDQRLAWVKAKDNKARLGLLADTYSDALVTTVNGLKTDHNEVFLEITSISQINADIISTLITNDIPLETVLNGDYSIATANPYITGFTSDSAGPARQYMYKFWNEMNV